MRAATAFAAAVAAPLALGGCMVLPYLDAPPASAYQPLALPDGLFPTPEQAAAYFIDQSGAAAGDVTVDIGRDPAGRFTRLVLVTAEGYEDDSVIGEQWRIALGESDMGFRVVQAGIRYNCARGDNPGWSTQPCP